MILALPIIAILALTSINVTSAARSGIRAGHAHALAELGGAAGELAASLQRERLAAALRFAGATSTSEYWDAATATAASVEVYRQSRSGVSATGSVGAILDRVDSELDGLDGMRERIRSGSDVVGSAVSFRYRTVIADLLAYRQAITQVSGVDTEAASQLRAVAMLAQSIEALAMAQTATVGVIFTGQLYPSTQREIVAADACYEDSIGTFEDVAPASWVALRNTVVSGTEVASAERLYKIVNLARPGSAPDLGVDAATWATSTEARIAALHQVEAELDERVSALVAADRRDTIRSLLVGGIAMSLALLAMLAVGLWVSSSLVGGLTRLRLGAESVATGRLPGLVERMADATHPPDAVDIDRLVTETVAPLEVAGRDEVGQVARAFAAVSERAVRLAADQAARRGDIRAVLMTLSHRLQVRVDSVLAGVDAGQREETDGLRLERWFLVDNRVALFRRLIAGLQIQAGARAGRVHSTPMALPDVIRAAQSGIEHYQRVYGECSKDRVLVAGDVVEELVVLLAELLDNATMFSPPQTRVAVEAHRTGDRLYVSVTDRGTGMGPEALACAREILRRPGEPGRRAAERMGLPVVAAIAHRLGIEVELRSVVGQGTEVTLVVPPTVLVVDDCPESEPEPESGPGPVSPGDESPLPDLRKSDPTRLTPPQSEDCGSVKTTSQGLPVRCPGEQAFEPVSIRRQAEPAGRTSEETLAASRRIGAFQDGLRAAGRQATRTTTSTSREH